MKIFFPRTSLMSALVAKSTQFLFFFLRGGGGGVIMKKDNLGFKQT